MKKMLAYAKKTGLDIFQALNEKGISDKRTLAAPSVTSHSILQPPPAPDDDEKPKEKILKRGPLY